jgi:hypothetical protein
VDNISDYYGEFYIWALVKEIAAKGILYFEGISVEATGTFCIGYDCRCHFLFNIPPLTEVLKLPTDDAVVNTSFKGILEDGRTIFVDKMYINDYLESFKKGETLKIMWHLIALSKVEIDNPSIDLTFPCELQFGLSNFKLNSRRLVFNCAGRKWEICSLDKTKETIEALKRRNIAKGITRHIIAEAQNEDEIVGIENEVGDICWLLSIANGALVIPEYKLIAGNGGEEKKFEFYSTITSYVNNYEFINIYDMQKGLKKFLEECYDTFVHHKNDLMLDKYIAMIVESLGDLSVESRLAIIIIAIEMISSAHARKMDGWNEEQVQTSGIKEKLDVLNRHLKFIPKEIRSKWLKKTLRNPLMHSGVIPSYDGIKLIGIYHELLKLSLQILFRILNYTGEYLDPTNGFNIAKAPLKN